MGIIYNLNFCFQKDRDIAIVVCLICPDCFHATTAEVYKRIQKASDTSELQILKYLHFEVLHKYCNTPVLEHSPVSSVAPDLDKTNHLHDW